VSRRAIPSRLSRDSRPCSLTRYHLPPRVRPGALITAVLLFAVQGADAQVPARTGLTISDVVRVTLRQSPRIQADAQQLLNRRGMRLQASAPFDAHLRTSLASARDNTIRPPTDALGRVSSSATDQLQYNASYEKQFRSGIVVSPELGVVRSHLVGGSITPTSTGVAAVRVMVPLLNNRGGEVLAPAERVADLDYRGSLEDLRHTAAASVRDAAVAYWSYLAAQRRMVVYRAAEERAGRLANETRALVRAEERPAADTQQLLANLATKRATRISAEQSVVTTREELGLTSGLDGADIPGLPTPDTDFPTPHTSTETAYAPDSAALVRRLTDLALARRADLLAAADKRRASQIEHDAGIKNLKPRLDLLFDVGYAGLSQGWGVDGFFSPLHRNVPGANTSVQLRYDLPSANSQAKGRALQLESFLEQQRIGEADVRRRVISGVATALKALRGSRLSLEESERAVALYQSTVENEKRKFQLGMSTLFDVIAAEDALTNALLAEIGGRRSYASAIADLRFATGTLVDPSRTFVTVDPAVLMLPP